MATSSNNSYFLSLLHQQQIPEDLTLPIHDQSKFDLARQMELESILLLKNDLIGERRMLPLNIQGQPIAVFGNGQVATNTGGGGSGGSLGSFRCSFIRGLNLIGAPYTESLTAYYQAKARAGGGTFINVHGWCTEDTAQWGAPQYSRSGWNHAAPISIPELKLDDGMLCDDGLVAAAANEAETAVLFISRTVGSEEMDRGIAQPSDWYLNPSEITLVRQICRHFQSVVLIVNSSGSMDLTWTVDPELDGRIKAIVWSYGAGSYYGQALADLLYGRENFSAKLADTMTLRLEDHYTTRNFGGQQSYASNGATGKAGFGQGGRSYNTLNGAQDPISIYQEYIYSGYRYFDTFCGDQPCYDPVLFPFGFGLSYAEFAVDTLIIDLSEGVISINARITNLSDCKGREVLQVYISAPNEGLLDQPYQKLMTYTKSELLQGGCSAIVTASFPLRDAASYSEDLAAYILEEGDYLLRVGNSSRSTRIVGVITVRNEGNPIIVEQLVNRLTLGNRQEFEQLRLNSRSPAANRIGSSADDEMAAASLNPEFHITVNRDSLPVTSHIELAEVQPDLSPVGTVTLQGVVAGKASLGAFISQMTDHELIALLSGGCGAGLAAGYPDDPQVLLTIVNSKPSAANSYVTGAGSTRSITRLGIPSITFCDGSAGIPIGTEAARKLLTDPNPAYPRAAGIACIWDPQLQYAWGQTVGREMRAVNVDIWLAPSINLHRNPLNGRNTEYYSEDPILSGLIASHVARGVAEQGVTVCLKHLAGNDQEQFRRGRHTKVSDLAGDNLDAINTITAERALREITLKPFEMAIRNADIRCVMSAFNKINGQYCASSRELLLDILRSEWNFKGIVVTDWGDYDEIANAADELENGNDIIMSGIHTRYSIPSQIWNGFQGIADYDGIHTGTERDVFHPLTRAALERNTQNLLQTIIGSRNAFDNKQYNLQQLNGSDTPFHVRNELKVLTSTLPDAAVGVEYATQKISPLLASGDEGTTCYIFAVSEKSRTTLQDLTGIGLQLHANGMITGQPCSGSAGRYPITFEVRSDFGHAEKEYELVIHNLAIKPDSLPNARLGLYYDQIVQAIGGSGQSRLQMVGQLPDGLSFDAETGRISGYPAESARSGEFAFSLIAADESSSEECRSYQVSVADYVDVAVSPPGHAIIEVGEQVRISIAAGRTESADLYEFAVAEGDLPDGLHIGGFVWMGYSISGSAVKPGIYRFGIKVIVAYSMPEISTVIPYTIEVIETSQGDIELRTDELPFGKVNELYSTQISAVGGGSAKVYSIDRTLSSQNLPNGLTLSTSGLLNCAPLASDSGCYHLAVSIAPEGRPEAGRTFDLLLYIGGVLDVQPAAGTVIQARAGVPFSLPIIAAGGFSKQYYFTLANSGDVLPEGLEFASTPEFTALLAGVPAVSSAGNYQIVIHVDEEFGGSPVKTDIFYRLEIVASNK